MKNLTERDAILIGMINQDLGAEFLTSSGARQDEIAEHLLPGVLDGSSPLSDPSETLAGDDSAEADDLRALYNLRHGDAEGALHVLSASPTRLASLIKLSIMQGLMVPA